MKRIKFIPASVAIGLALLMFMGVIYSCKKDEVPEKDKTEETEMLPNSYVKVLVKHSITQQPLRDVVLDISSTTAGADFETIIDRTDQNGELLVSVPSPNDFMVAISDSTKFTFTSKGVNVESSDTGMVVLQALPKFGESIFSISTLKEDQSVATEIPFKVSYWDEESGNFVYLVDSKTNAEGIWYANLDFPAKLQIVITDTVRFEPDTVVFDLLKRTGGSIALNIADKEFKTTTLGFTLSDIAAAPLADVKVNVYTKISGQVNYSLFAALTTDANGKLNVEDIPIPGKVQVVMSDTRYPYAEPVNADLTSEEPLALSLSINTQMTPEFIIDRAGWEVIEFDSELAGSEAQNVLDGDEGSNWHSPWSGNAPPWPHYFVVDMKRKVSMHGFAFKNRGGNTNGAPKEVEILVSDNNINFTSLGKFNPEWIGGWQAFSFSAPAKARYVKFIGIEPYTTGAAYTNMSEFGLY